MGYLQSRLKSFGYAFAGLSQLVTSCVNFRIHIAAMLVVNAAGLYFSIGKMEWIAVWICIGIVLITEAINTAIEEIINLLHPQQHPLAGKIKDIAAAAVLIAAIVAVIVALIIFLPYFSVLCEKQ